MDALGDFVRDLEELVQRHARAGLAIKIENSFQDGIIRILADNATPLARAKHGINDARELANTAAEHHPLWGMLEGSTEITDTMLERWQGYPSKEELDEVEWHIKTLEAQLCKLRQQPPSQN